MTNETIENIVTEMRLHTRCSAADAFYDVTAWTKLCDRIEKAAKRENDRLRSALDECVRCAERYEVDDDYQMSDICRDIRDCRRDAMGDEYLSLDRENELLRATLAPVLAIDLMNGYAPDDSGMCIDFSNAVKCIKAIREAQRIYKEGEAK